MADQVVELEIPARPEFVSLVRLLVAAAASQIDGIDSDRIDDLKIAVSEACTNAIEAHTAIASGDRVVVTCGGDQVAFEVCVVDRGHGFDPASLPEHPPVTDPERLKFERGLGIPLIRSLVDEVEFSSSGAGTQVLLRLLATA